MFEVLVNFGNNLRDVRGEIVPCHRGADTLSGSNNKFKAYLEVSEKSISNAAVGV